MNSLMKANIRATSRLCPSFTVPFEEAEAGESTKARKHERYM